MSTNSTKMLSGTRKRLMIVARVWLGTICARNELMHGKKTPQQSSN